MTPHPQPGYLAPSARSQEWIQQTLAGRQQLRVIALRASPSHLARIPESTLPAAAREAFAARTAHESQNMEKNRFVLGLQAKCSCQKLMHCLHRHKIRRHCSLRPNQSTARVRAA